MLLQLTSAGRALLDAMPEGVIITRADFGDSFNYTLPQDPVGIDGNLVYSANSVWYPQIVDPNTTRYSLMLPAVVESFSFGEIALFSDTTLFGVAVNAVIINKVGPYNSSRGQLFKLDLFIDLSPGQRYAVSDLIGDQKAFARVSVPDLLKPPALNETNAYIVYGKTEEDVPYLAFADPTGKWGFSAKPQVHIQGIITDVNTYGLESLDLTGSYTGQTSDLVLQFVSGTKRGYCRQVSSIVDTGVVWTTPLVELPEVGDSFIIVGPNVVSGGGGSGGGGSGGGGSSLTLTASDSLPFSTDGTSAVIPQTFSHYMELQGEAGTMYNVRLTPSSMNLMSPYNANGYNTALGYNTLRDVVNGNGNTAVGDSSLISFTTGFWNAAVGKDSLSSLTTGLGNVALGSNSGSALTTGSWNVVLGGNTGASIATSNNNIIISDGEGNLGLQIDQDKVITYPGTLQFLAFSETVLSPITTGAATLSPDLSTGSIFTYTLTGNVIINYLTNARPGSNATIILKQDGAGYHTLISPMLFADGFKTIDPTPNSISILNLFYDGAVYYVTLTVGYA